MKKKLTSQRGVLAAKGFLASAVEAAIKQPGRKDMTLLVSRTPAAAAALFTTNQFPAAPVQLSRNHLRLSRTHRAVLFNSGSANASTGPAGLADAEKICRQIAQALDCRTQEILMASTGVIGTRLPRQRMLKALPRAIDRLSSSQGLAAAQAIMTTDKVPKLYETTFTLHRARVSVGGMAKGAGMIHPRMATLLAAVTTDLAASQKELSLALRAACAGTFNAISVDGETSTNDTVFLLANGAAGARARLASASDQRLFLTALTEVMDALAQSIVRDGEGASKLIEIQVRGAHSAPEAMIAARAIGDSLLVKTAIHGEDANWGRVISALGATQVRINPGKIKVDFNHVPMVRQGRDAGTPWAKANQALRSKDVLIEVDLGQGKAQARYRTCDLTAKYIEINAGYRS